MPVLAASMALSGITVWPDARGAAFAAEQKIQIESVEDLEKIGKDSQYPMNKRKVGTENAQFS